MRHHEEVDASESIRRSEGAAKRGRSDGPRAAKKTWSNHRAVRRIKSALNNDALHERAVGRRSVRFV
jgi:hypothetical protein